MYVYRSIKELKTQIHFDEILNKENLIIKTALTYATLHGEWYSWFSGKTYKFHLILSTDTVFAAIVL